MTASELARFLKEEVPQARLRIERAESVTLPRELFQRYLDALDAAVGLLREAEQALASIRRRTNVLYRREEKLLATLRLVVGEKETG